MTSLRHRVIIGSPGTGKTRTLVDITRNFQLRELKTLYCSHTKAAAQEAMTRWGKPSPQLTVSTLHAFAFNVRGLTRNQVVDNEMAEHFGESIGFDDEETDACLEIIGFAASTQLDRLQAFEISDKPVSQTRFATFCREYMVWKEQFGLVDFNDMLIWAAQSPDLPKFDGLIVDEAQDLTPLHWAVVSNLIRCNPGLRCVMAGDGNQALYEWSGADPHGMENFLTKHGGDLRELEQSYRVPIAVHGLALQVAKQMKKGGPTNYLPRDFMGSVQNFMDFDQFEHNYNPSRDSLILYSNGFIRAEVEEELRERRVLYEALGGAPAPAQTRAGQAMVLAAQVDTAKLLENPVALEKIYRGLTESAAKSWSANGPAEIIDDLKARDFRSNLNIRLDDLQYFYDVDWTQPLKTRIATIHGAKGHEAQDVHLINSMSTAAIDHSIVNPDAMHRVAYVAVTRASENLFIYNGDQPYEFPT